MIVAKPGWLPEYMGGFKGAPEVDKENYVKYDKATKNNGLIGYILVQFVLILLGISALMYRFEELSSFYKIALVGAIVLSMMICGAIFENKKWVIIAEYLRLAFILFNVWFTISGLLKGRLSRVAS
jgi:hypothetical protein